MKKLILFFVLISATVFGQQTIDKSLFEKKEFKGADGQSLLYRILYPEGYDKTKKYPLILFLHGAGERGDDNELQLTHGIGLFLNPDNRSKFPAIVIFPQCPKENSWNSMVADRTKTPVEMSFDNTREPKGPLVMSIALVNQMINEGCADPKRIYVMGLSMGGMGTFEAVYRNPKLFAAAVPICGGGDVNHYNKSVKKVAFWVFHGDQDKSVNVKYSREMVDKLKSLKAEVKYTEYPGIGHNSWDNAFAEADLLPWMFSHRR